MLRFFDMRARRHPKRRRARMIRGAALYAAALVFATAPAQPAELRFLDWSGDDTPCHLRKKFVTGTTKWDDPVFIRIEASLQWRPGPITFLVTSLNSVPSNRKIGQPPASDEKLNFPEATVSVPVELRTVKPGKVGHFDEEVKNIFQSKYTGKVRYEIPDKGDFPAAEDFRLAQHVSFVVRQKDPLITQLAVADRLLVSPHELLSPHEMQGWEALPSPSPAYVALEHPAMRMPWASPKSDMSEAIRVLLNCVDRRP